MRSVHLILSPVLLLGCSHSSPPPPSMTTTTVSSAVAPQATSEPAAIGKPAPDFTLPDTEGHPVHLADYRGKTVVLEWFNPNCPFVNHAHTKNGSLVDAAKRHAAEGVVWLAINSAAPGRQGYGAAATLEGKHRFGLDHPILLDESGTVGHAYGATNTPHMFVIDKAGTLAYAGAIDNSPDGEGESPTDPVLIRYVDQALSEIAQGHPVSVPSTKPYGCSVKYAGSGGHH